jgi:hypothetical protein
VNPQLVHISALLPCICSAPRAVRVLGLERGDKGPTENHHIGEEKRKNTGEEEQIGKLVAGGEDL